MNKLPEGQAYAGRSADVVPIQCSVEREALELAKVRMIGPKKLGAYFSRLVYEDVARKTERERLQREGQVG